MVGAVFTMVGAWVRVFGEWNFWPVFGGQVLAAIGQPFILNAVPLLAANYFPRTPLHYPPPTSCSALTTRHDTTRHDTASQRTIATAIASIANPIGTYHTTHDI
jgi:hypothetical protein